MAMSPAVFEDKTLDGAVQLLSVSGELDLSSAPELSRRFAAALHGGARGVVIDLTGLEHLDSSGLAALIGAQQRTVTHHASLVLVVTSQPIVRTLEIRGLDGLFTVAASRDDAIASVRDGGARPV